ncbi:MAG: NAD(P)H-quinone oxidoreductase [Myxococcota bacterium]
MRAVMIAEAGGPEVLKQVERPDPDLPPNHIRIRVHAVGVNRADVLQRRGLYPAPPGVAQDIPGLEYAGEVAECGAGATRFKVGAPVMGLVGGAAYAEQVVVHEREAIRVPTGFDIADAAAIPEVYLTAFDGLTQLRVRAGERVLIHAIGSGVGTAALQLVRWMGAVSVGTSRTESKLTRALELGLDEAVHVTDAGDFASRLSAPVHATLDLVGGAYFGESLKCLDSQGRHLIVGLTAGVSSELSLGLMLRKRLMVKGTNLRSRPLEEKIELARRFETQVAGALGDGLKPIVDRVLPMDQVADAHRALEANETFGKIILRW